MSNTLIDPTHKPAGVVRIVFKEIVSGDRRKFEATSNDDPSSGGGARDLRFRPYEKFGPVFSRMFTEGAAKGICKGEFHWIDNGKQKSGEASFHPPTNARPGEGRLANVDRYVRTGDLPGENDGITIFLLIQDEAGKVWPRFTTDKSLENENWHDQIKGIILRCLHEERNAGVAMVGLIDFETKETYCNGKNN